jgi:diaminopimelate epimerase
MKVIPKRLEINGNELLQLNTGTEHVVLSVGQAQLNDEDFLRRKGRRLRHHRQFQPEGTNVNFIDGKSTHSLRLQTFERGVEDLTLACGTGALASALAWHHIQKSKEQSAIYSVETKGGTLSVHFSFDGNSYFNTKLEGPAHFVFEGKYLL